MLEGKTFQDEISVLNIYAPNTRISKFVKEILLKFKIHIEPYTIGMDTSTLSSIDRYCRPKKNRNSKYL